MTSRFSASKKNVLISIFFSTGCPRPGLKYVYRSSNTRGFRRGAVHCLTRIDTAGVIEPLNAHTLAI